MHCEAPLNHRREFCFVLRAQGLQQTGQVPMSIDISIKWRSQALTPLSQARDRCRYAGRQWIDLVACAAVGFDRFDRAKANNDSKAQHMAGKAAGIGTTWVSVPSANTKS